MIVTNKTNFIGLKSSLTVMKITLWENGGYANETSRAKKFFDFILYFLVHYAPRNQPSFICDLSSDVAPSEKRKHIEDIISSVCI